MPTALLATAGTKTVPDISVGHALLQMVLALAVIVVSIVVLTKILARIRAGAKGPARRQGTKGLTVLSRQSLGKDLSIAAVKWGDRQVLVGISGSTITFLNDARSEEPLELETEPPAPAAGDTPAAPSAPAATTFSPALLAAAARQGGTPALAPARAGWGSLLDQLRDATARH